jgi:DNA-binding transcriptional MerR regulator
MEGQFMKAYSIKEVQQITKVPSGTIRQWEKDLEGVFNVPRDENRNRYYTDFEIDMIKKIKQMRDKNLGIAMIKDLMKKHSETLEDDSQFPIVQPSVPQMSQDEAISTLKEIQVALKSFEKFKEQVKTEIRNEVRNEIRNEILTEVTKQIAATSVLSQEQVKTITSSISNTSEEVLKLSKAFEEETKRAEKDRKALEDEIKKAEEERQLIAERDRLLVENMRVLKEIREEQNKSLLQKLFGKKNRSK